MSEATPPVPGQNSFTMPISYAEKDSNLLHQELIGRGVYGEVHKMLDLKDNSLFARKLIHLFRPGQKESVDNEIRAISILCMDESHENIVQVLRHGSFGPYCFIDMELCEANLRNKILAYPLQEGYASSPEPLEPLTQISNGLKFIHSRNVIHRNLTPSNILYSDGRWKIAGFVLAAISGNNDLPQQTEHSRGTAGYRAPELVSEAYFSSKVDIWALGCIAYEIMTRTNAFSDDFDIYSYSIGDFEIPFPSQLALGTSEYSIWQAIRSMLQTKGVKRPTARAVHCKFRSLLRRHRDGRRSPSPGAESETSNTSISSYESELSLNRVQSNTTDDTVFDIPYLSKTLEDFLHFDCEHLMAKVRREHIPVGYQEAQWSTAGDHSISCVSQIGRGGSGRAYEMLVPASGEVFARKIIFPDIATTMNRMTGVEMDDWHNEIRVNAKIAESGGHENIIAILHHGWLEENRSYFFDMERCPLTLELFLYYKFPEYLGLERYFQRDAEIFDILKFWVIVEHITKGLNFIHHLGEVHRDLKPSNVLLSIRNNAWQISDFGLTQQGTSRIARYTQHGRGSEGYRGPEMVRGTPLVCKQTDIFSLGCVIYELATGSKLFIRDFDLFQYMSTRGRAHIPKLEIDAHSQLLFYQVIHATLDVDWWKRPSAQDILNAFTMMSSRSKYLDNITSNLMIPDCNNTNVVWKPYCETCFSIAVFEEQMKWNEKLWHANSPTHKCGCFEGMEPSLVWKFSMC